MPHMHMHDAVSMEMRSYGGSQNEPSSVAPTGSILAEWTQPRTEYRRSFLEPEEGSRCPPNQNDARDLFIKRNVPRKLYQPQDH